MNPSKRLATPTKTKTWNGIGAASMLNEIKDDQKLTERDINNTEWLISYPQVWKALNLAKNGTAMGLDGCPYEL